MNILFTGMDWFPERQDGGLSRYFYEEVQAFAAAGFEGTACVSCCQPQKVAAINVRGMAERNAPVFRRWKGASDLVQEGIRNGANLIDSHFALYARPALHRIPRHMPLVVHFHGPWTQEILMESTGFTGRFRAALARRIERDVYARADRVITLSEAFKTLLHQSYGVPLERIRVIPGGVDVSRFSATPERGEARRRLGWPEDRPILLAVRRLARRMGLDRLIEAIAQVRLNCPDVLLLVGGKGKEERRLRQKIAEIGVGDNVRLLGFIPDDDLAIAYAAADVSIVPTIALEGFGLISVESLAAGTPVLGTPIAATPEILTPLSPKLVFDSASAADMASRIEEVVSGRVQLPDGASCREYARRFQWSEVIPRIQSVFEEAIAEKRSLH